MYTKPSLRLAPVTTKPVLACTYRLHKPATSHVQSKHSFSVLLSLFCVNKQYLLFQSPSEHSFSSKLYNYRSEPLIFGFSVETRFLSQSWTGFRSAKPFYCFH
ncbi:hypothetical protein L596_015695 [Steinernema carpocapsae]|uniref:Uncharacterized protein n=1 Tax=Steinernema carpocapsae TaxID=34508 RepID=A0A4U5NGL6_STECR|nr:hypothetical protein L596_015695 [Steinernema carpocapsae]